MEQKANEKYQEILRLDKMLTEAGIPHVTEPYFEAWSISYPTKEHPAIWALCIGAMYNCESKSKPLHLIGFMEIDGDKFAFTYDDEITAEKVFKRIETHYTGERK